MEYEVGDYILRDGDQAQVIETVFHCFQGEPLEQRIFIQYESKTTQWVPSSIVELDKKRIRIIKINELLK